MDGRCGQAIYAAIAKVLNGLLQGLPGVFAGFFRNLAELDGSGFFPAIDQVDFVVVEAGARPQTAYGELVYFDDVAVVGEDPPGAIYDRSDVLEDQWVGEGLNDHLQANAVDVSYGDAYAWFVHDGPCFFFVQK